MKFSKILETCDIFFEVTYINVLIKRMIEYIYFFVRFFVVFLCCFRFQRPVFKLLVFESPDLKDHLF